MARIDTALAYALNPSDADPPRKEEYRPAPGPDTSLLDGQDLEGLEAEEEEQEFEFAEDLVRYIDREWKGWFCVGVAGQSIKNTTFPYQHV